MSVNDYIGVPFREDGVSPDTGWNCWALVCYVAWHEFGIAYPSYSERYSTPLDHDELTDLIGTECRTTWTEVPAGQEQGGDVIILRMRGGPLHAGLVIRRGRMLHVHTGIETTNEDYTRPLWNRRIDGFFRR